MVRASWPRQGTQLDRTSRPLWQLGVNRWTTSSTDELSSQTCPSKRPSVCIASSLPAGRDGAKPPSARVPAWLHRQGHAVTSLLTQYRYISKIRPSGGFVPSCALRSMCLFYQLRLLHLPLASSTMVVVGMETLRRFVSRLGDQF